MLDMETGDDPSPDKLQLTVDGMVFEVAHDSSQPGAYHYTRIAGAAGGPAVGYGFTSRRSSHTRQTTAAHIEAIRGFIAMVHPVTGYIEDADDISDE
jgi:hypothetical protein